MALEHSPRIVTDGLVFSMDGVNPKSWNTGVGISTNWVDTVGGKNGVLSTDLLHTDGPFIGAGGYVGLGTTSVDYLNIENSGDDFTFGTGPFTIECWVYPIWDNTSSTLLTLLDNGFDGGTRNLVIRLRSPGNGNTTIGYATYFQGVNLNLPTNQWYHIAFSRQDNANIFVFINGVQKGSYNFNGRDLDGTGAIRIGKRADNSSPFEGYISNFRIIKGDNIYKPNTTFIPPKEPLKIVPGTVLLTCQNNRVVDAVGVHTITTGTDGINLTKEPYDGAGAFEFDGSADSLSVDSSVFNPGTGDFTIEWWQKLAATDVSYSALKINSSAGGDGIRTGNTAIQLFINGSVNVAATATFTTTDWEHVAIVRSSGVISIYHKGVLLSNNLANTSPGDSITASIFEIGESWTGSNYAGSLSNFRVVVGTAVYTSNFTPPTTSLEPIKNTTLLTLQGENIKDASSSANAITRNGEVTGQTISKSFYFRPSYNTEARLPSTIDIAGNEITLSVWNYGIEDRQSSIIELLNSSGHRQLNVHLPWQNANVYFDKGATNLGGYDRINKAATRNEYQGWHHWAFTANATTGSMKIYLDGALWHSGTGKTKPILAPDGDCWIGRNRDLQYHNGYVSNLQLFKKEFTASEVLKIYNTFKGRYV